MSDTPETDAAWDKYISPPYTYWAGDLRILAQRLERERDEARHKLELCMAANSDVARIAKERDEAQAELEMWRDGNIMHQIHRDELEKAERERDEYYARAASLVLRLPPETIAGEVQQWRDEFKADREKLIRERDEARELHRNALREREATEKEVDAMLERAHKAERERDEAREALREAWLAMDEVDGTDRMVNWQNKNANILEGAK
jgi:hypothetical protein